MNFKETKLAGLYVIETNILPDERGLFVKVFTKNLFEAAGLSADFQESYYSISKRGVIRGMHFQSPPTDHAKLVYVTRGTITDVILDIRAGSPTYGQYVSVELSEENRYLAYVPPGFAHGFAARTDEATVTYVQTSMYSPDHDQGIRADSFSFDWEITHPIQSKRDQTFPALADFKTPFTFKQ